MEGGTKVARRHARMAALVGAVVAFACIGAERAGPGETLCAGTLEVTGDADADGKVEFRASNACEIPQLVAFEVVEPVNLEVVGEVPPLQVIPGRSKRRLATARRVDASQHMKYSWRTRSWAGDPDARTSRGVAYRPPFGGGEPRLLRQGPMGKISHQHKFAYDFGMPVGTPILAARSGTVYSVRDGHTRGGNDPRLRSRANEVVVVHADATFATYGHLRPGIGVRVGQRVETGTLLGYSGNTGYTDGPHLHFEVWVRSRKGDRETVPVRFRVDGRSVELAQGARVEPQAQR